MRRMDIKFVWGDTHVDVGVPDEERWLLSVLVSDDECVHSRD